jgi:hypothetical protein
MYFSVFDHLVHVCCSCIHHMWQLACTSYCPVYLLLSRAHQMYQILSSCWLTELSPADIVNHMHESI